MRTRLHLFFLILLCLNLQITNAAPIGLEQAREKAKQFFTNEQNLNIGRNKAKSNAELELLFTEESDSEALFYVFSKGETGFVIVSADDGLPESILGYSFSGRFCPDSIPADARYWLDTYGKQINLIRNNKVASVKRNNTQKENLAPLTTSTWNQRSPFNDMCPTYNGIDHCLTGCVPTAFSQLMYYYKWPERGNGRYTLETTVEGKNVTITEDFSKTIYQWDIMQDSYEGACSRASKAAVGTLMYHMGIIGRANWGAGSTPASSFYSAIGLHQYFSYKKYRCLYKDSYSNDAWEDSIYNELRQKRPVVFSAESKESSHCFICDGYEDGYFHMNWGWGGYCDGYFLLTALNADPSDLDRYGYNYNQYIYLGIEPDHNAFSHTLSADGVLTIEGKGDMPGDFSLKDAPWKDDNKNIHKIVIGEGITSVVKGFSYNQGNSFPNLEEIILPESLLSIEDYAFSGCNSLAAVTIPNSVTSIGYQAFFGCGLTSVRIPNSVTELGAEAFSGCKNLVLVTLDNDSIVSLQRGANTSMKSIFGDQVKEYIIGNSVKSIGVCAFYNCRGLISVTIPESVTSIGVNAFCSCSSLTSITLPESVTYIASNAFYGTPWYNNWYDIQPEGLIYLGKIAYKYKGSMPNGTQITIKDGTSGIASSAFSGCSGLTSVTIPNSVTSIDADAFKGCSSLSSVTISNNVTYIGSQAFMYCGNLTSIAIPDSLMTIGSFAFRGCSSLEKVIVSDIPAWCRISFDGAEANPVYNAHHLYSNDTTEIKNLIIPSNVTSIGNYAFYYCSGLTSVTIPESVTSIGVCAFSCCSGLTSVTIPESVTNIGGNAFFGCSGLTSVIIPNTVTSYGNGVFQKCSGLTTVTIDSGVTSINADTFRDCSKLTSVEIPNSVTSIGGSAFCGCSGLTSIEIPNSVTSIEGGAFYGCGLTSIEIPNSVTKIEGTSFYDCRSLASITIPESVTNIGQSAFSGCSSLSSVHITDLTAWCNITFSNLTSNPLIYAKHFYLNGKEVKNLIIPDDVRSISAYAFCRFGGLISVTIPNNVTSIGISAFSDCSSLTAVHISDLSAWCNIFFHSNPLTHAKHLYLNGKEVKDLVIPDDVNNICQYAFDGCSGLTSVTIPNSVTIIGNSAFSDCDGLTSVTIGSGVTSIGNYAFSGCGGLTSVTIGSGVTSIGNYAFSLCGGLTDVYCLADNVPQTSYNDDTFFYSSINSATLHVPKASLEFYKTTSPWSDFGTIVALSQDEIDGFKIICNKQLTGDNAEWYDIQGRKLTAPQKGINIIRNSDGTTNKFLLK